MLEVKNLKKSFGNKEVLKGISFSLNEGEAVSLLGSNGSGKTTTFRIMADLLQADEGEVLINGSKTDISKIGYLPEERCLYYDCTVYQQLKLIAQLNDIEEKEIEGMLKLLKIEKYKDTIVSKLSKGNQQKVAVALCLIKNPEIVIMDEPFTGLDIQNIKIFEEIIRLLKYKNKYIIVSSHIYQPVNSIADRYIYLKDGLILFNLSVNQLHQDSRKVIHIYSDEEYLCTKENIICLDDNTFICENSKQAEGFIDEIKTDKSVYGYSCSSLNIEDMVKLYETSY